ncbi:MAG TPA: hypothetical protein VFD21_14630 [Vicinamibacterales bacterium]|nr:hypothetical protein [Vicinamibacterales bacterium]
MLLAFRPSVHNVVAISELLEQPRDFFRGLLQIVVHCDDHSMPARPDSAEQRVVLTVIPHQIDAADLRVAARQRFDGSPAVVAAAVVDQDDLVGHCGRTDDRHEPIDQCR